MCCHKMLKIVLFRWIRSAADVHLYTVGGMDYYPLLSLLLFHSYFFVKELGSNFIFIIKMSI